MVLFVALRDPCRLALGAEPAGDDLALLGDRYRRALSGGFTGFHDWLRTEAGRIVGVRLRLLDAGGDDPVARELRRQAARLPYAAVRGEALEIFFGPPRRYVPERSADQAFGGNHLFLGETATYLVTFDLGSLAAEELADLRRAVAVTTPSWSRTA